MCEHPARTWPALDVVARRPDGPADLEERLLLALDGLEALALETPDEGRHWRVYFALDHTRDRAASSLEDELGAEVSIRPVAVADEGWARRVQQDLHAVRVGRIVVAPPWDIPADPSPEPQVPSPDKAVAGGWSLVAGPPEPGAPSPEPRVPGRDIVIVIEPSMGFGTGHHQSTRLMLEALQQAPLAGARVIDAGTGSGVLALAAVRLGAREVVALDNDEDSVAAARDNARLNGLDAAVDIRLASLEAASLEAADLVTANLTAWLLRQHADALRALVNPGGRLVASGFTRDQAPLVRNAFPDFELERLSEEDDWLALVLRCPPRDAGPPR